MTSFNFQRWTALLASAGLQWDGERLFREIARRYSEPQRAYHNALHIDECLREFDLVRAQAMNPVALELAIWFHDVIYDPRAGDNEEQSARFATECLKGSNSDFIHQVSRLILTTKSHVPDGIEDAALLSDIDLSILGKSEQRFEEFEAGIRREYAWAPAEVYRQKRAEILSGFLKRERIYVTEFFYIRYETIARRHVAMLIAELRGEG